ncbi:MAG: NAD+ synthase [Comamonadaceae bacterium]|nr:NAD+ synthase [Comamonadaceae bacterium]
MALNLCIVQLNPTAGDLPGNARRIIDAAQAAHAAGAQLLLTPALSICGFGAQDLLWRPAFISACQAAVRQVAEATAALPGLTVVVGHPLPAPQADGAASGLPRCHHAASVLRAGHVVATACKQTLCDSQVFDESRHFLPGDGAPCVFEAGGLRMGLLIGADACQTGPADPVQRARQAGAQCLAVVDAAPWHAGQASEHEAQLARRAQASGLPLVYANMTGGQDELLFGGGAFAVQADGTLAGRAPAFEDTLFHVQATAQGSAGPLALHASAAAPLPPDEALWRALVLGLRDYVRKNGFQSVLLGLSGGIDSALVLALAVDALGAARVHTVMMPSPYTAAISLEDAREMARRVGVRHDEVAILPAFDAIRQSLAPLLAGRPEDTTEENIQARVRGVLLMALSNKLGHLVLTTGNKSEYAVGYCTLYGDMCGGFAPIKDVLKTRVFALARWRNAHDPFGAGANPIPERIITRPPSAELRPGQTDQDSLPPYEVLDALIEACMERDQGAAALVAAGFRPEDVAQVMRLLRLAEYKRRQSAPGPRVSPRAFGKDWRYPITNGFRDPGLGG